MLRWVVGLLLGVSLVLPGSPSLPGEPPRDKALKERLLLRAGGNAKSEAAVAAGLQWIVAHQAADGHWGLHDFHVSGKCNCSGAGGRHDIPGTAFALLPLLGAGHTHQDPHKDNRYARQVEAGLQYLLSKQDKEGNFGGPSVQQALATQTLCLAYHLSGDPELKAPAQRAVDFICWAQGASGGWRYAPRFQNSDTEQTGWQMQALRMAQVSGLRVPPETLQGVGRWLDDCAYGDDGAGYGYMQPNPSMSMTAVGLLCRQFLGWRPSYPGLKKGVEYLFKVPPGSFRNMFYYYHATQVMHHMGGSAWATWNPKMRDLLLENQDKGDDADRLHQKGSWPAEGDAWGAQMGRLGITSLALLMLEIYYSVDLPLAGQPAPVLKPGELQVLWNSMNEERVLKARQAMWALAESPAQTVPFLAEQLPAVMPVATERLTGLLKELDDPQFAVRQKAQAELENLGDLAEPPLRKLLASKPPLEVRQRAERLLKEWQWQSLRRQRAVQTLETMATTDAKQLLETLSKGAPEARLTQDAKAALERMLKR